MVNFIKEYNKDFTNEMIKESIFVIDNNCLLFPLKDYVLGDKIVDSFNIIKNDVYIPYVTQIEYLENESNTINKRKEQVKKAKKIISDIEESNQLLDFRIKNTINNNLFNEIEKYKKDDAMRSMYEQISSFKNEYVDKIKNYEEKLKLINDELAEEKNKLLKKVDWKLSTTSVDEIKRVIEKFLDEVKLGLDYTDDILSRYTEVINERYNSNISPGYEDIDGKSNRTIFLGGKSVPRHYSDAIFWLDTLDYIICNPNVTKDKKYLIIISNEGKQDWVVGGNKTKINLDMYSECYRKTGLIVKKIDIWTLLNVTGVADGSSIEISRKNYETGKYDFRLYGQDYIGIEQQSKMMEIIFEKIISKIDGSTLNIPCVVSFEDSLEGVNTTFDKYLMVRDSLGNEFLVGTSLNFSQKLRYIFDLLDSRVEGSAPQLKFMDSSVQSEWEKICRRRKK
ncbi:MULTISPECIES: PIN-like domain-containing protein [unclassified Streptococcus]|uniref:PIN-like domain-containing protein n=1 Tax=unclassified Streptococcus TaxID=2608887 RepID=UPI001563F261|nr:MULTISPECIES: PIN-like domain-containing protein [unclassified Streptococcus]